MQPNFEDWLKRKQAGPAPRKRIPTVSAKMKPRLVEYRHAKRMHLAEHPTCQISPIIRAAGFRVRCRGKGRHVHHVRGRLGKLLCDRRYFLTSCEGECHPQWIHESHKAEAIKLGLLVET